ncbi:hypothetical protein [Rhodococcus sp. AD45]|uniref:hypothetical protein n=1 Tax=Rhodococcus sp. (strain AD45) TaxID=103808 RepID=UPI0005D2D99E|nr:hypothetical protein [Rhodococcus sp. AD45]KJF19110.1 hypothetical protein SZ00_06037 [Rhodococcus sp. AD45]
MNDPNKSGDTQEECTYYHPSGRSTIAKELARLPKNQRRVLGLEDWAIGILDAAVTTAAVLGSDIDDRPFAERLAWLSDNLEFPVGVDTEGALRLFLEAAEETIPLWAKRIQGATWKRFLRRLIGAAAYDRLIGAVYADTAVVVSAVQAGVKLAQPYALAIDDCAAVLSPEKLAKLGPFGTADPTTSALRMFLSIDSSLTRLVDTEFNLNAFTFEDDSANINKEVAIDELVDTLRRALSGDLRTMLDELSVILRRKLVGAVNALESSDDGVSQAAHSLVELIDRVLRTAFPEDEVIEWLRATGRPSKDYLIDQGQNFGKPTKRSQALCFVYGGAVTERSPFHEMVAESLIVVRTNLQKLKHADLNTPEEENEIRAMLASVEGFLTFAIQIGWLGLDTYKVDKLRERFAA